MQTKPTLLTGDTPTGKLHLGHWVGSHENRIALQDEYQCYFPIANAHALSTKAEKPGDIHQSVLDIILDYLSMGIDPKKSCIFIESDIPAIFELATYFSMLIPFPRLMRNPTIKDEIRDKQLGDQYSMGFLWYPVLQVADILAFKPDIIPVGEDQAPHLELAHEVARRFNRLYCNAEHDESPGLFPIFKMLLGRKKRLVGLGGPNADGNLLKMSKSLDNAILLSDSADRVKQKIMGMYTDPNRLHATDPGTVENNPLWIFHDTFNSDTAWITEAKEKYRAGKIGDVECKKKLIEVLNTLLEPMRKRRKAYEGNQDYLLSVVRDGAVQANKVASQTLHEAKLAMQQVYKG